jgi:protein arginine kinase
MPERAEVLEECMDRLPRIGLLDGAQRLSLDELTLIERLVLVESHLISRELMNSKGKSGAIIKADTGCSVMINEEDHLRLQLVSPGMALEGLWQRIDALDSQIESCLGYAFSAQLGYITACPTNLGTGMRASAMLHLPGLVLAGHMEQVVRMVNQLGIAVRGHFGEGSDASGSFFQISNQQTLGEDEATIVRRLHNVLDSIIEQEHNARFRLLEDKRDKFSDKIGRARGILQNGHLLCSEEAMDTLSLIRLAVDMGMLPVEWRGVVDRLVVESQPGHMQRLAGGELPASRRDVMRAAIMREQFAKLPALVQIRGEGPAGS